MKKKFIIIITVIIMVCILGALVYNMLLKEESSNEKFAKEYTNITEDNVFIYKSLEEINKILKHGTGIVYLGFPECPWCKAYVAYLNEEAKKYGLEKIYYANVKKDREENSKEYQETISILGQYLQYDEEGNKRLYVPAVIAVNKGEIVGFDDETAWDTKGYKTPEEYWEKEDLPGLRKKMKSMFEKTKAKYCTSNCNK